MVLQIEVIAQLGTMSWVYAAVLLLVVLFILLVTPYFGLYGTRDIEAETSDPYQTDGGVSSDDRTQGETSHGGNQ